jgi:uncharacterized membrane protein
VNAALEVASLLLVGLIAGAELGSWCCVQPVVARLPYAQYVAAEQAMLRTFGRIMPVLMPLSGVVAIALIVVSRGEPGIVLWLRVAAALCIAITVVSTLTVNVPINNRTAGWRSTDDAAAWQRMRRRWHVFQGVRGGLFAAAFVLLTISLVATDRGSRAEGRGRDHGVYPFARDSGLPSSSIVMFGFWLFS